MEFAKAEKYKARVSEKYYLNESESFMLVKLELVEPNRIDFKAGQYVSIKVNERGERRSYSIASTPDVNHAVSLVAEIIPGGKGSEYLKNLKPGDAVEILAPLGRFTVELETMPKERKLLFVATGSGIAPIYSMINELLINKREIRPIRLHWGMRDEAHMFWFDNFERLAEQHPYFVFDQVLSKPNTSWEMCTGHVQECIGRDLAKEEIEAWEAYVCGNPKMVEETKELLIKMGLPESQVHHEKFT